MWLLTVDRNFDVMWNWDLKLIGELANIQEKILEEEKTNIRLVLGLYEALSNRDVDTVHRLLAPDIEWWFHGPPCHQQHMNQLLTGGDTDRDTTSQQQAFLFVPSNITAIGSTVLAEGFDQKRSVSWVHAWTVNTDGVITQIREYFNTSLTVARFENQGSSSSSSPSIPRSSSSSNKAIHWESKLSGESVPGLVLAI
ncbi:hypothetical protein AQUCO_00500200v1 [Aquilegia coerulea]|uniref:Wound-induced protein 1 n=1 Tax=Aquilegia coerulea TaxID=218851 RepID=A0A2G5EQS8_AQUCA|nr:hypothetical protein AQUCO_00500200v1 [Aquilegia coerulea]